jgi:short-subunit dehydrogenase
MKYAGRTALVTGASSGIGAAFARELAARSCTLVLVARREDRLEKLARELESAHQIKAYVVPADLSRPEAAAAVRAKTEELGLRVDMLVNNAGFGTYGPFETIDPIRDHDQVMVNVAAAVALTHVYLPDMVELRDGVVINISSAAAFQPMPYQAVYAASKAFLQSFSEALWAENRNRGVRVVACCPAATDTEYFDVLGNEEEALFGAKRPPSGGVDAALRALERNRPSVVVGLTWKLTALMPRLLPRATVAKVSERTTRPKH